MRAKRFLSVAASLVFPCALWADAVVLKSGERIEGRIVRESDSEVVIEVQVSASVIDQKTFPKTEVDRVDKDSPAETRWREIEDVKPGANSRSLEGYDEPIEVLETYLTTYPDGPHNDIVKERLEQFKTERNRVRDGEMKINSQWLSAEQVEKEKYQINAMLLFERMKEAEGKNDPVSGLNAFALLERDYPGSRVYPDAVDLAVKLVPSAESEATRRLAILKRDTAAWEKGVKIASEPNRSRLIAAAKAEQAQFDQALAAAEKQGLKWGLLIPRSESSLNKIKTVAAQERKRLASINTEPMRQSLQKLDQAVESIKASQYDKAADELKEASSLWSKNEAIKGERELLTQLKSGKPAATPTPQPTASPRATATRATPTPASPSPTASPTATATPTSTPTASPSPTAEEVAVEKVPEKEVTEKPFYLSIPLALCLVAVTGLLAGITALVDRARARKEMELLDEEAREREEKQEPEA